MALTYEQLTEILLAVGPDKFEVHETRPDGSQQIYRGSRTSAFFAHNDGRMHEHKVFDATGALVYHRDVNGRLYEGNAEQWRKAVQRQKAGRAALTGLDILKDSWRRARRAF